ncbi:MAG: hypothetical protein O7E52_04030 [Candidatus Poribacteria bacterium]|nr:hypothetical protein [Candidatus Poribacteria bacterium]
MFIKKREFSIYRKILILKRVGFDGGLNSDHIPALEGDGPKGNTGSADSVGYINPLFAARAVV